MTKPTIASVPWPLHPRWRAVRAAAGWPTRSQQHACRNALAARTVLLEQRRERQEVERFLREHAAVRDRSAEVG